MSRGRLALGVVAVVGVLVAGLPLVRPASRATPAAPAAAAATQESAGGDVTPAPSPSATLTPTNGTATTATTSSRPQVVPAVTGPLGPPPGPRADVAPARTAAPDHRFALVVGVQHYRPPTHETVGSRRDALVVRQALLDAGWLPQNVRTLVDAEATGAAVRDGLAWLAARSTPGTFALFHYSGHVKQLGGSTEALWPVDRDFVRDTEVVRALAPARGRLWVDVMGCEAGGFLPGLPGTRVLVTASSTAAQKSYEYPAWAMSVWTGLLFEQGLRQRRADADGDGRTTVGEALRYAAAYAQQMTRSQPLHGPQTPQVAGDPVLGWTLSDPPA